jgi:heme-degrading monooxygenase HmoA
VNEISVINSIIVPSGMEGEAENIRNEYVNYFKEQEGFVSSTFYRSTSKEDDKSTKYVNIVVWASQEHFEKVVNMGFRNTDGVNKDGMKVLGKGFPEPIIVYPGQYAVIGQT